ncbi:MAG: hypothetical protein PHD87_07165 [Candidatus Cloacimonetes bacterium]|nr:hypothetical protein [Candidatus Cloacimonadota bacterium]
MRKFFIMMIVATLAMGLFLTGCIENITQPEDAKWSVMAIAGPDAKEDSHVVTVMWIGEASEYVQPTTLELKIGGVAPDSLIQYGDFWMGGVTLTPGTSYYFQLIVDGSTVVNTRQAVVYNADATFPLTFNPTQSAYSYWTLDGSNETQTASAYAWDPDDPNDDEVADTDLTPAAREYTFPANMVQDHGDGSAYTLEITQINHKYVDNVLVATAQSDWSDYGDWKIDRFAPARLAKYVRRMSERALAR